MHYAFDAVLMSLPIFAAATTRAHIEGAVVAALILVPLWVVLMARIRVGRFTDLPQELRNQAWAAPPLEKADIPERVPEQLGVSSPRFGGCFPSPPPAD